MHTRVVLTLGLAIKREEKAEALCLGIQTSASVRSGTNLILTPLQPTVNLMGAEGGELSKAASAGLSTRQ